MAHSPEYQFSESDQAHPVFCIGCRSHIPKAVSDACNGVRPICIAKINQSLEAKTPKDEYPANIQQALDNASPENRDRIEAAYLKVMADKQGLQNTQDKLKSIADKRDKGANNMQSAECCCLYIVILIVVIYLILAFL